MVCSFSNMYMPHQSAKPSVAKAARFAIDERESGEVDNVEMMFVRKRSASMSGTAIRHRAHRRVKLYSAREAETVGCPLLNYESSVL